MPNLKEVRGRIISVRSIQQITKAMKMVSAAKLKRASDAIIALRPYAVKLKELLEKISSQLDGVNSPFLHKRTVKNVLVVAITSNRGQAGAFNTNIIKASLNLISSDYDKLDSGEHVHLLAIGRKGFDYFNRRSFKMQDNHNEIFSKLNFAEVSVLANLIMKGYEECKWDKVELVYNQFKNAAVQIVTREVLLPLEPGKTSEKAANNAVAKKAETKKTDFSMVHGDQNLNDTGKNEIPYYIFEPSPEEIVKKLIPEAIRIQLYKALLDSHAAEHGARMTSMEKATENAGELLRTYRLQYNRARQAAITTEILEIVSGANALSEG